MVTTEAALSVRPFGCTDHICRHTLETPFSRTRGASLHAVDARYSMHRQLPEKSFTRQAPETTETFAPVANLLKHYYYNVF